MVPQLPSVYYWDGPTIGAVNPDGSAPIILVTLPTTPTVAPRLLPDGRLLYQDGGGFGVIDRYGRRNGVRAPDLNPGESIWSVLPSPDGRTLAWQLFSPLQVGGYTINTGSSRVVLTGRFGDAGTTVMTAQAGGTDDGVPMLAGWRPSSSFSLSGGPTLLLQNLYDSTDTRSGVTLGAYRGLLEYDPAIDDVVDDYLPPLASDVPGQRALSVSADGAWAVVGDGNALTPSGEGPLATTIDALDLNTDGLIALDSARDYPTQQTIVTTTRRTVKKHTVTRRVTSTLRLYQYFSYHAYVAPDDSRVLYTLLTVSYPPGALAPRVQSSVLLVGLTPRSQPVTLAQNARAQGWIDAGDAVIQRADGLYALNIATGGLTRLVAGGTAQLIGVRH